MTETLPLTQFPNTPLMVACPAGELTHLPRRSAHADASATGYLGMTTSAHAGPIRGANRFRRLLSLPHLGSSLDRGCAPPRSLTEIVAIRDCASCGRVTKPADSRPPLGV
jgi:hypothetical protein